MQVLFWVTLILISNQVTTTTSQANQGYNITKVYAVRDELNLLTCKADLIAADENGNEEIDGDEWAIFVERYSNFRLLADSYQDINIAFIMIFISISCQCANVPGSERDCCMGSNANIDLRGIDSPERFPYFFELCMRSELTIYNLLGYPPTTTPTMTPTLTPSNFPTKLYSPTGTPTAAPSVTISPSIHPSFYPTGVSSSKPSKTPSYNPTFGPSPSPTCIPSYIPTSHPTTFPTYKPTSYPSSLPTEIPTSTPSLMPSNVKSDFPSISTYPSNTPTSSSTSVPSRIPSYLPSVSPTSLPTITSSLEPSIFPSSEPSSAPTDNPKKLEFFFPYGLVVDGNLTADDILNERNNSVKEDLIIATTSIIIQSLNETYPFVVPVDGQQIMKLIKEDDIATSSSYFKIFSNDLFLPSKEQDIHGLNPNVLRRGGNIVVTSAPRSRKNTQLNSEDLFLTSATEDSRQPQKQSLYSKNREGPSLFYGNMLHNLLIPSRSNDNNSNDITTTSITTAGRNSHNIRLAAAAQQQDPTPPVYYTNAYPVLIFQVFDDECVQPPSDPNLNCVIVRSLITIVVEDDTLDRGTVREQLVEGLRDSFKDGSFLAALPK